MLTPIFGWGKNRAALKGKKAAYEAEIHSYEKTVLTAFKETRNAIVNFNKIKEVLVPIFGYTFVVLASPLAWVCADMFLIPAYRHVMKKSRIMA